MLLLLKFDIYFRVDEGIFELYELVPQKKRWQIRLEKGTEADVERLMLRLTEGLDEEELQDLLPRMPTICSQIIQFLQDKRLFSDLNPADRQGDPFFRQLEVFDSWNRADRHPSEIQKLLSEGIVLLIGAGGVGSMLANLLTSTGVGPLYCVDYDRIETHNLARQSLYTPADIGAYKVEILARRLNQRELSKIIPIICRLTVDNVNKVIKQCGSVHIATGFPIPTLPEANALIGKILEHGIPFLCVGEHDVGPLLFTASDIDVYRKQLHEQFLIQKLWERGRGLRARLGLHPSYAPSIAIVNAIAADEIVRYLTGYAPIRTREGIFSLNPITSEVRLYSVRKPN